MLSCDNLLGDLTMSGARDQHVRILCKNPLMILITYLCLQWLAVAQLDGLHHSGAARRDEINLHAKGLDHLNDYSHFVHFEVVQQEEGHDPMRSIGKIWL